jgi:hypothetical protein
MSREDLSYQNKMLEFMMSDGTGPAPTPPADYGKEYHALWIPVTPVPVEKPVTQRAHVGPKCNNVVRLDDYRKQK